MANNSPKEKNIISWQKRKDLQKPNIFENKTEDEKKIGPTKNE